MKVEGGRGEEDRWRGEEGRVERKEEVEGRCRT
jgi:hypothetical protein